MHWHKKLCYRKLWKYKSRLLAAVLGAILIILSYQKFSGSSIYSKTLCEPIDVVYTWVNGSEHNFLESIRKYTSKYDDNRYDDKNELRYSLRSLDKYVPWVRHIYIVTNGQIPNWLDLSNERISIVPHEMLCPKAEWLPTFSSSSIETFIHRIPNLSERFLYLNDDIFVGAHLYPEDLFTDSEGVRIYNAWLVPDCAEDCPWAYVGDGACDKHCNISNCQYDGGDCSMSDNQKDHFTKTSKTYLANKIITNSRKKQKTRFGNMFKNSTFRELLYHQKNLTQFQFHHFKEIVDKFNHHLRSVDHRENAKDISRDSVKTVNKIITQTSRNDGNQIGVFTTRKDMYSKSLIHTNMLLNQHYGFKVRKVLAHVGFLLERSIIEAMQGKFALEIMSTASKRFRSGNDLQFALAYYSYLMEETVSVSVEEIFDEFDTDHSLTWSDRELRTLLVRIFPLPLDVSALRFFGDVIDNCSQFSENNIKPGIIYTNLMNERYMDSNLPTVTRSLVKNCVHLAEALKDNFSMRPKYKFNVNPKNTLHSNFIMLTSNITEVVIALDSIRKNPRKFNCINDNMNAAENDDNRLIRHLLEDFYLSFFPERSQYELPTHYRNRFRNWSEYQSWRRRRRTILVVGYGTVALLVFCLLKFSCKTTM